jgi:uncharacterized protein YndB with AHSA1/START domain
MAACGAPVCAPARHGSVRGVRYGGGVKRLRRSGRRWLAAVLVLAVAAIAAVLGAAWVSGLLFTDVARPASAGSALERFRASDPHPGPLDGVYTYRTRGGESLDVLGRRRHRYPDTTTITVVETPPCVRLRWDALAGRSTTWTLCTGSGSVALRRLDEVHSFFGQTDRTLYACTPQSGGGRFHCRSRHGVETGQESVAGYVSLDVGGVRVRAIRVRMTARVSGGNPGIETLDWWLVPRKALPLELVVSSRTSRSEPLIGQAHYHEDAALRLLSMTPKR